ncbi:DExH-box ATP-dependent RNA helicase DExH15 chloroplastic-like [Malania oleifera]|uniref:DExH-box ATP-dependent RNA helicase DExH15 chloroplastic-like n=1 Tax=Malania oleifera TaxID=397392 RepID=UPI0025ADEAB5|nr:DExH-box ATP-dependent RNA helicase DExH15 chloroplastic-like [Malania oleifera]
MQVVINAALYLRLRKGPDSQEGFKEYKKIMDMTKLTEEKIKRLKARSNRLISRMEQIEPYGWKEFLQISNVIHETRALYINSHVIFPLGETAAAIQGENELRLAMVLRNKILLDLKPPQLAAVYGSLVSEGIKVRPWKNNKHGSNFPDVWTCPFLASELRRRHFGCNKGLMM